MVTIIFGRYGNNSRIGCDRIRVTFSFLRLCFVTSPFAEMISAHFHNDAISRPQNLHLFYWSVNFVVDNEKVRWLEKNKTLWLYMRRLKDSICALDGAICMKWIFGNMFIERHFRWIKQRAKWALRRRIMASFLNIVTDSALVVWCSICNFSSRRLIQT